MSDLKFISRCLELARKGEGSVSPNPMVGAVIVRKGRILAEGFHRKFGGRHAEIEALRKLNFRAAGATLYCNLEPCCHLGKTPPCVDQIIASGIKRVVISHLDPNPKVSGRSIKILRKSGVKVKIGALKDKALFLNRFFITWVKGRRPYVILKMALSLDGKIGRRPPLHWITGPIARRRVHEIRSQVDAILVGAGTVLADNPRLTIRGVRHAKQPVKIILSSRRRIPRTSRIFQSGREVFLVGGEKGKRIPLPSLLRSLAKKGIASVLVEGGGEVFRSFYQSRFFDEMILHIAPKVLGEESLLLKTGQGKTGKLPSLRLQSVTPLGTDTEFHFIQDQARRFRLQEVSRKVRGVSLQVNREWAPLSVAVKGRS